MDRSYLLRLMPTNKEDVDGTHAIAALGFPVVDPVLDDIIKWFRTVESPVALAFAAFLASNPHACRDRVTRELALGHCDGTKYVLISRVVPEWPREHLTVVAGALLTLLTHTSFHDTDLRCIELLAKHELCDQKWLARWARFKVTRLRAHVAKAEALCAQLSES